MGSILEKINSLLKDNNDEIPSLIVTPDSEGIGLEFTESIYSDLSRGRGNELALNQFYFLNSILEQGLAEKIPKGVYLSSENAVNLDDEHRRLFNLPSTWNGGFSVEQTGLTYDTNYKLQLKLLKENGDIERAFDLKGPILHLGTQTYLLDKHQFKVVDSINRHSKLKPEQKGEIENLLTIHEIFNAQKNDVQIEMPIFSGLKPVKPEKIGVTMDVQDNGDLELTANFGERIDPEIIKERLHQLGENKTSGSLRLEDKIIILDENHFKATQEIIKNKNISADQKEIFFKTPSAFLDSSLIDLDLGFSLRVKGVGTFKHAYFGETDHTTLGLFEGLDLEKVKSDVVVLQPSDLMKEIKDSDQLEEFINRVRDARATGADEIRFEGKSVNISDQKEIDETIETLSNIINEKEDNESDSEDDFKDDEVEKGVTEEKNDDPTILKIVENDENEGFFGDQNLPVPEIGIKSSKNLILNYKREPYPHQMEAIKWLLALAENEEILPDGKYRNGALLADDMGLGKTYSSLVFISEYLNSKKEKVEEGPVLIVAPLILLDVWKVEVEKTYQDSPFDKIILLQAGSDLPSYKKDRLGNELRNQVPETIINSGLNHDKEGLAKKVRYALKHQELGKPRQLILTTYDNLRDYQFSLGLIEWSVIVFDEAQNIKNPDSLKARAAKALKSKFKLLTTGTPVENSLKDFWSLFDCLEPNYLDSYQTFRTNCMTPILKANDDEKFEIRKEIGLKLRAKVGGYMLRRVKEDELEGLPKKHVIFEDHKEENKLDKRITCRMPTEQLSIYNDVLNATIDDINSGTTAAALKGLHEIRSVSLHPSLLGGIPHLPKSADEAQSILGKSGKLVKTLEILQEIKNKEEKVIIFLTNKNLQRLLAHCLLMIFNLNVDVINGDTKTVSGNTVNKTRKSILEKFCSSIGFNIIILSPLAAGVGLTIIEANHVIHLERHWNPAKEAQATDRVYRIGQKKDVFIYLPILIHDEFDTFDVKLSNLLKYKLSLKDAIVTPGQVADEELFELFGAKQNNNNSSVINIEDVTALSWEHFEAIIAEIYAVNAKEVKLTSKSKDYNCDVVVIGEEQNILIQCKHHSNIEGIEGINPIYEIESAREHYEKKLNLKFEKLLVYTTYKKYEKQAIQTAKRLNVDLKKYQDLKIDLSDKQITREQVLRRDRNRTSI
jgi:SNF2 family DNA or RNA helicase